MKKISFVLLVFIVFQMELFSVEKPKISVIERSDRELKFAFYDHNPGLKSIMVLRNKKTKNVTPNPFFSYEASNFFDTTQKNSLTGPGNVVVYLGAEYSEAEKVSFHHIKDLKPETEYELDFYFMKGNTLEKKGKPVSYTLKTTVPSPNQQARNILYSNAADKSFDMKWSRGDGKKCLVVMKIGKSEITPPTNGTEYDADVFGKGDKTDKDSSFVVYNGTESSIKMSKLSPNTLYTTQIFEYNGKGDQITYLKSSSSLNPSYKKTLIEAPVLKPAENITSSSFTGKWSKVYGAEIYEMEIATDAAFKKLLPDFETMDVGNINEYTVEDVPAGQYFVRVRAMGNKNFSQYSNIITVTIK